MKVLFFYQHFWPDSPPYANMLRVIGSGLSDAGHSVSVVTSEPSYKASDLLAKSERYEKLDGVSVNRLSLLPGARTVKLVRLFGKAIFPARALLSVVLDSRSNPKPDVIIAATIPPIVNGLMAYCAARLTGARFIYHMQDIYPEIGSVGGLWSSNSWRHRLLKKIDSSVCRKADTCIVLSQDMAQSLCLRGVDESKIAIINNFMLADFAERSSAINEQTTTSVIQSKTASHNLVFAGNLGRFQGLEEFLEAFVEFPQMDKKINLHIIGDGIVANKLREQAGGSELVFFYGHQPYSRACELMKQCDAGIVSIQPNIYKYAYPSKTLTYLGLGLPVLALIENDSSMAADIAKLKVGVTAENTDKSSIHGGLSRLIAYLDSNDDREHVSKFVNETMSTETVIGQWVLLIASMKQVNSQREPNHA